MRRILISAGALLVAASSVAFAAIPVASTEEMQEGAPDIVVGKVAEIRAKADKDPGGHWIKTDGVVEIAVVAVEKGTAFKQGDTVKLAYWTEQWFQVGDDPIPPHGAGHDVPKKGDVVRAYVVKPHGVYEPYLPNGIVTLSKEEAAKFGGAKKETGAKPAEAK